MKLDIELDEREFAKLFADSVAEKILAMMWNRSMTDGIVVLRHLMGKSAGRIPALIRKRVDEVVTDAVTKFVQSERFVEEVRRSIRSTVREIVREEVVGALREYYSD